MPTLMMQCAWCRRRYDETGIEATPLPMLLPEASHGLCLNCLYLLVKRQCERLGVRGDVAALRRAERTRWRLLVVLLRQQLERPDRPVSALLPERHKVVEGPPGASAVRPEGSKKRQRGAAA